MRTAAAVEGDRRSTKIVEEEGRIFLSVHNVSAQGLLQQGQVQDAEVWHRIECRGSSSDRQYYYHASTTALGFYERETYPFYFTNGFFCVIYGSEL